MTPNILLEYFKETLLFKNFEEFIKDFCNLNLHLYSLETSTINNDILFNLKLTSKTKATKTIVKRELVETCIEEKKTIHFQTIEKTKCILIPIVLKNILSGLILVEENPQYPLNKAQVVSIERMLSALINNINSNELHSFAECKGTELSHRNEVLDKVTNYISSRYNTPELTLSEIARDCAISYYYLSHLFKKELNTTFSKYLTDLRLSTSIKLLKDKRLTISEISGLCGFLDSCYFGKVFKKRFKIPPITFRENLTTISQKKALKSRNRNAIIFN